MNPIFEQLRFMNRIVGLRRLLRMRKKHALGLMYARGYAATMCFWSLLNTGLLDELRERGNVNIADFAKRNALDSRVLHSICEYLDGIRLLKCSNGICSLDKKGMVLMDEPRGLFDLLYGYEPVMRDIEELLRSSRVYGRDIERRGAAVAKGSGELGRQLPFLAVRELVFSHGFRRVLDLGCGDLEFLFLLCENPDISCFGVDKDSAAVQYARSRLQGTEYERRVSVRTGDMFEVEQLAAVFPDVDAITAIDVFHEYLYKGDEVIVNLLRNYKKYFPSARLVVAEFFKIPHVWLRRVPTVTLEHHLLHALTNQVILPVAGWIELFEKGGYSVVDKKLLHAIGHGYFVLA
jgi:SAM-dependent methyltransferase